MHSSSSATVMFPASSVPAPRSLLHPHSSSSSTHALAANKRPFPLAVNPHATNPSPAAAGVNTSSESTSSSSPSSGDVTGAASSVTASNATNTSTNQSTQLNSSAPPHVHHSHSHSGDKILGVPSTATYTSSNNSLNGNSSVKPLRSMSAAATSAPPTSTTVHPLSHPSTPFLSARILSHHEKVKLNKHFTAFHIRVQSPALHWECEKRYSEFRLLHEELQAMIAKDAKLKTAVSGKLPKLPPKKISGNMKDAFLTARMAALDGYLTQLLSIDALNSSIPVLSFLGALEGGASRASDSKPSAQLSHLHLDAVVPIMEAGDIVLFRTKGVLQGLQRVATGSKYDHVGVVIRIPWGSTKPSSLHLLESTSDGVKTYNLARRMRAWHLSCAVVAIRQLKNVKRNTTFMSKLDEFVSDVDGLPYGLTLGKLLRREMGQSKDTFFCSELVATAYMRVGLIDPATNSASSFYPSSFNQANSANELKFQQGAELGPEIHVDFVQPAVSEARANVVESDDEDDDYDGKVYVRGADRVKRGTVAEPRRKAASRADANPVWADQSPSPPTVVPSTTAAANAKNVQTSTSPLPSIPSLPLSTSNPADLLDNAQVAMSFAIVSPALREQASATLADSPFLNSMQDEHLLHRATSPFGGNELIALGSNSPATVSATPPTSAAPVVAVVAAEGKLVHNRNRSVAFANHHFDSIRAQQFGTEKSEDEEDEQTTPNQHVNAVSNPSQDVATVASPLASSSTDDLSAQLSNASLMTTSGSSGSEVSTRSSSEERAPINLPTLEPHIVVQ